MYRVYDHRIKQAIARSGNPDFFPALAIPRSSAMTWIRRGVREVVTVAELDADHITLLQKIASLEWALQAQIAKGELVVFTFRIFGLQIQYHRLPDAHTKATVLARIKKAAALLPLSECLDAISLSAARYHNWIKREVKCLLPDQWCSLGKAVREPRIFVNHCLNGHDQKHRLFSLDHCREQVFSMPRAALMSSR